MNFLIVAMLLALTGCAAPPPMTQAVPQNQTIYIQRDDLSKIRNEIEIREKKLQTAKLKDEIDQLNQEIANLHAQMTALEKRIEDAEKSQAQQINKSPSNAAPSGANIGPRGGCYTITKSGKKNYGGC